MERNVLVDRLKGYACFLVLFGHVIMGIRLAGIDIPQVFWWMEKFIWSFHVALFLFLSGVVYNVTGEWRGKKTKAGFLLHKLYTLGIPYVTFSVVYILINSVVANVNTGFSLADILDIWKTPVAQYWYLYALFFLFCIWTILSGLLNNWQITLFAVALGYFIPFCGISISSLELVLYSALAFGIGTFVNFKRITNIPTWSKCIIVFVHLVSGTVLVLFDSIEASIIKELMMLFGIYSSVLLISMLHTIKPFARFLDFVNRYSFQIYLLHTIFTAGIRIVMIKLNVNNWVIHVLVGTIFGLVCSVLVAKLAEKVKLLNAFFFPAKSFPFKKGENKHGISS